MPKKGQSNYAPPVDYKGGDGSAQYGNGYTVAQEQRARDAMNSGDLGREFSAGWDSNQENKGKNQKQNQDEYQKSAHVGVDGPNGSQGWTKDASGAYTQHSGFNGALGGANDSLQNQAGVNFSKPLGDGSDARNQAINGAYSQATSRLNPQWDQNATQLQSQLANQGLDPNSQAYRTAMQNFGQQKNDAYSSAMNGAIGQGTAAQQATFNENLAARNAPLNSLIEMQGLIPNASAAGANGLAAMQAANQYSQQSQANAAEQYKTAAEIGGAAVSYGSGGPSDSRIKDNIHRTDMDVAPGVPFTTFEYKAAPGHTFGGVIAQDLEKAGLGGHVKEGPDGVKRVTETFRPFYMGKK